MVRAFEDNHQKAEAKKAIPEKFRVNMHVHSAFSDGQFTPEALVLQAIKADLTVLGITYHYNTRKTLSLKPEMLARYLDELDRLNTLHGNKLRILKGIEINTLEFFLSNHSLPPDKLLERLDFVLFEYVTNIPRAGIPLRHTILISRDIPVICGLAHTDLPMAFPEMNPEDLVSQLNEAEMFLELNESYRRPGERHPFYDHYESYLACDQSKLLKLSVGSDNHHQVSGPASRAIRKILSLNLERNLICL